MRHHILVLGAGYAGASATGRLARRLDPATTRITLVNADRDFIERIRLHQLATGQALNRRSLPDLLTGTATTFRLAQVVGIDVDTKSVSLADGEELSFDTLIIALGSGAADHGTPGLAEHAHELSTYAGAKRLRARLNELTPGQRVVVVGGGLTGVEAVTEIAEGRPELEVHLLTRGVVGDWLSPNGQRHLRKVLSRLHIAVHEGTVREVTRQGVVLTNGHEFPSAVTVWSAGFAVNPIMAATGLKVADTGQVIVDETMRSLSHPHVYAVGDAAHAPGPRGMTLRMSCASGIPAAKLAADAIVSALTDARPKKTSLRYIHQCISLGRSDGIIQLVTADDRPVNLIVKGRAAARYKELVCASAAWVTAHPTFRFPTRKHRVTNRAA